MRARQPQPTPYVPRRRVLLLLAIVAALVTSLAALLALLFVDFTTYNGSQLYDSKLAGWGQFAFAASGAAAAILALRFAFRGAAARSLCLSLLALGVAAAWLPVASLLVD